MANGLVDGVVTQPDSYGKIQGNGGAVDKLAGSSSDDMLQGHAAFNQYYGGAGNDTFIIEAKFALQSGAHDGASTNYADQFAYVTDFQGAGGYSATNNDFVSFTGFGSGAVLTNVAQGTASASGAKVYYYTIDWTDSASVSHTTNVAINSVNGVALGAGDYAFF